MTGDADAASSGRALYYVDIERNEAADAALEKVTLKEAKAKAKKDAKKLKQRLKANTDDSSSGSDYGSDVGEMDDGSPRLGARAAGGGILSMASAFAFGGRSGASGAPPPPPSSVNPYSMIETRTFLGSDGGRGEDEQLPPPRPSGLPPREVSKALFENAGKRTYEVQYYKVGA
jgi:hypothetical protein